MLKKAIYPIFIITLFLVLIITLIVANFTVPPFVTNIELSDSLKYEDKMVINIDVGNYFYKFDKTTYCIVISKDEKLDKDDDRWIKAKKDNCSFILKDGDYDIYLKDRYGNVSNINTQKVKINKVLEVKPSKGILYMYNGMVSSVKYNVVKLGDGSEEVTWSSDNESVATVDQNGNIKAVGYGTTTVNIAGDGGIAGKVSIVVSPLITKPKIDFNKAYVGCNQFSKEEADLIDQILFDRVNEAGYGTRAGVVAAARFATLEFSYRIDYFYENGRLNNYDPFPKVDGEGRYYHRGMYLHESKFDSISDSYVGPAIWGCKLKNFTNWGKWVRNNYYPNGLDCSGFVSWVLLNGGFDIGDIGAGEDGDTTHKSLPDLGTKLNITPELMNSGKVKAGDLIGLSGHAAILAGWDDENYYIAESLNTTGGVVMTTVPKSKLENRQSIYTFVVLMDDVYKEDGNYTQMW